MTRSRNRPRNRRAGSVRAIVVLSLTVLIAVPACGAGEDDGGAADRQGHSDGADGSDGSDGASRSESPEPSARQRAATQVDELSLREKAGQVIVAGFDGTEAPTSLVAEEQFGGVILMEYNVDTPDQVRRVNRQLQQASDRPWPLLLGVDQEGGPVTRIGAPATEFPSYQALGAARDPDLAERVARASGAELRGMGFTAVFAPDADVTIGPEDPTIGTRSAGSDPDLVADTVAGSVRGYRKAGLVAVPKHFPGHGSVSADSHQELPVQSAGMDTLAERDLVPFRAAANADVPAMMTGHLDVRAVDPGVPSSLSRKVNDDLLRDQLGFDGVVITDGLHMGALTERFGPEEIAVRALRAGADVLLLPADPVAMRDGIVHAVRSGDLDEQRLDQAATRMIAMQLRQAAATKPKQSSNDGSDGGADEAGVAEPARPGTSGDVATEAALSGLTILDDRCGEPLASDRVSVSGGEQQDRDRFAEAARRAGLQVVDSAQHATSVRLTDSGEPGSGDVVVALDSPYGLADSDARTARVALFGRTPASFRALAAVLVGKETGTGRLPVQLDGVPADAGCGR